jgi:heme A synthase
MTFTLIQNYVTLGSAPATPGFNAVAPEWLFCFGAAEAAPAVPAAESTLGSHPCVALSSAQVLPEWINRNLAGHAFASN